MKKLEKILLATDFTEAAYNALQTAMSIAKIFNSDIILIHVIRISFTLKKIEKSIKDTAKSKLDKLQNEITKNNIKVLNVHLAFGNAFDQIIKYADFYNVNLIMMGSGEKERADQFQLGITAHKVIRKSSKPVWVVKPDSPITIKKIVCPVDFSIPAQCALKNAIYLAKSFNAELTVLTVVPPIEREYLGLGVMPYEEDDTYFKYEQSQFDKFLEDFDFYNVKLNKTIVQGIPHQEILKTIASDKADLLVIGSMGKSALTRILIGSVAEKVIRNVPCSIITLKSEDAIRLRLESDKENIEGLFDEGKKLMDQGFEKEALHQFQLCLNFDIDFEPAWESLVTVYERLGDKKQAETCKIHAKQLREKFMQQKIEAEMLSHYTIFGKSSH